MHGNLGRGVSRFPPSPNNTRSSRRRPCVRRPDDVVAAFKRGEMEKDVIVVLRSGPQINGMPELHKLTPLLGVLQDKGFQVALVTDGRMSGASGKVPSAIHMCPECSEGGPLARVKNGDIIHLNTQSGEVNVRVAEDAFNARTPAINVHKDHHFGMGRELFGGFRLNASSAETGASNLFVID